MIDGKSGLFYNEGRDYKKLEEMILWCGEELSYLELDGKENEFKRYVANC